MSTLLLDLIPADPNGASRTGSSFRREWRGCRTRWAYVHLMRHPGGEGRGLVPVRPASPLNVGTWVHAGLAALYTSRCRDGVDTGEWDLDFAIGELESVAAKEMERYVDEPAQWTTDRDLSVRLTTRYASTYGPGGPLHDYPEFTVAIDRAGQPIIEREFAWPLGWPLENGVGLQFTVRVDIMMVARGSWLEVWDHKTAAPSRMYATRTEAELGAQFTGLIWTLDRIATERPELLPPTTSSGMRTARVNILNKQPAATPTAKSPPAFLRHAVSREPAELRKFHLDFTSDLVDIEAHLARFHELREKGTSEWDSLRQVFPMDGTTTGGCQWCPYTALCSSLGREEQAVQGFRPKVWDKQERDHSHDDE